MNNWVVNNWKRVLPPLVAGILLAILLANIGVFDNTNDAKLAKWEAELEATKARYDSVALASERQALEIQQLRKSLDMERDVRRQEYKELKKQQDEKRTNLDLIQHSLPGRPTW